MSQDTQNLELNQVEMLSLVYPVRTKWTHFLLGLRDGLMQAVVTGSPEWRLCRNEGDQVLRPF